MLYDVEKLKKELPEVEVKIRNKIYRGKLITSYDPSYAKVKLLDMPGTPVYEFTWRYVVDKINAFKPLVG